MNTSIELKDVTTGYKNKPVTRDINAYLLAGELTCLLGPNGAGKSTLLKTLSAFIPPLRGEIMIEGKDLKQINARMLARSIAVVLTQRPSTMNMTVEELVAVGRSPYTSFFGGLHAADKEVVDRSISLVGIDDLRHRNVNTLSDGERQKALIAKALAQQTQIIFLDEPTAFLDYPSKVEIMKLLYTIAREEDKTVFMSTHDIELALQIADKIWLLDKIHGLQIGIPEDLAYNGLLGEYFERGGLRFNYATGQFEIEHEKKGMVRLSGEGRLHDLVKKALRRVGYIASPDAEGMAVEIINGRDGEGAIVCDGKSVTSIESLVAKLKRLENL
ncbi:MAG: ABC transporter ATP-binding protein [Muribaculaceae bacterium]|nr:ABC transporter ATP-binding protein [Muribaculaceae bacterium]